MIQAIQVDVKRGEALAHPARFIERQGAAQGAGGGFELACLLFGAGDGEQKIQVFGFDARGFHERGAALFVVVQHPVGFGQRQVGLGRVAVLVAAGFKLGDDGVAAVGKAGECGEFSDPGQLGRGGFGRVVELPTRRCP